jgi:hypothetical protein
VCCRGLDAKAVALEEVVVLLIFVSYCSDMRVVGSFGTRHCGHCMSSCCIGFDQLAISLLLNEKSELSLFAKKKYVQVKLQFLRCRSNTEKLLPPIEKDC